MRLCRHIVQDGLAEKYEHPTGKGDYLSISASHLLFDIVLKHKSYRKYLRHEQRKTNKSVFKSKHWWLLLFLSTINLGVLITIIKIVLPLLNKPK